MPFQRDSCRIYNHEIHGSESGVHNFYSCNHGTHIQLRAAQHTPTGTAWPSLDQQPGTARPGQISAAAVWHGSNRSPTPWVVSSAGRGCRLAGRAKWYDEIWLHAINPKLYTQ